METILKTWKTSRKISLDFFEKYTLEQLNKIPAGFNNNLIWNIGHIIAAQQFLIYKGSNNPMHVPDAFFDTYKAGTKPTGILSQLEADELKGLLMSLIVKTEEDLQNGIFKGYNERTTLTGFHLGSVKDAFEFNNYHEGLHLGCMMSIRKFV